MYIMKSKFNFFGMNRPFQFSKKAYFLSEAIHKICIYFSHDEINGICMPKFLISSMYLKVVTFKGVY